MLSHTGISTACSERAFITSATIFSTEYFGLKWARASALALSAATCARASFQRADRPAQPSVPAKSTAALLQIMSLIAIDLPPLHGLAGAGQPTKKRKTTKDART